MPLRGATDPVRGHVPNRYSLLLWMFTDEGTFGIGEASPPGPGSADGIAEVATLLHDLAPSTLGLHPAVASDVLSTLAPHTDHGETLRFGMESAMFDLVGQSALRPVADLLGGVIDWVPMSANIDYLPPEEAARAASDAVLGGYECVKLSLGARDSDVDVEVVRQVREAIGDDVELRADADEAWTPERAIEVLTRLDPYNLEYVEQPVMGEDLGGLAKVRQAVPMPIAADEAFRTYEEAQRVIEAGAADVLVVKPSRAGGVKQAKAILELARENGLVGIVASSMESGVGIAVCLHLAASLGEAPASSIASGNLLEHDMLKTSLVPVRGHITVPQNPGLGIEVDQEAVDRYTTGVMGVIAG